MTSFSELARKLIWKSGQPLTKRPSLKHAPVSDLFLWRSGANWDTYFQLTNISALCDPSQTYKDNTAEILVFDKSGIQISRTNINTKNHEKILVNISDLAQRTTDEFGTFCVLHSQTPPLIVQEGGNLAERGYVAYSFNDVLLKYYIHGNLDAICNETNGDLQLLGGTSLLSRNYDLQYIFKRNNHYQIALANPTNTLQKITLQQYSIHEVSAPGTIGIKYTKTSKTPELKQILSLNPRASTVFELSTGTSSQRVSIKSHLVMARPLVFSYNGKTLNAFHG